MAHPRATAQSIAKSIRIPPRPEVLITFHHELNSDNPDFNKLVNAVSSDVSLSGAVLQVINSPAFGMRNKITSIAQACSLLGMPRVEKVVKTVALRSALSKGLSLEQFWSSANEIANLSRILAMKLTGVQADDAYTLGLFHNCGIPLLMQHFPDYKQTLIDAEKLDTRPPTRLEDERFGVNHTHVGYEVAAQWFLPDTIAASILMHHQDLNKLTEQDVANDQVYTMIIILKMAEYISASLRKAWRSDRHHEWTDIGDHLLELMDLAQDDFNDVCAEVIDTYKAA